MRTSVSRFSIYHYKHCEVMLSAGKMTKKLKGNTWLERSTDTDGSACYYIRFYNTIIVRYYADGRILLYTGGHASSTTKSRIKQYSPVSIYQKDYTLYVGSLPFFEGMNVGTPQNEYEALYQAAIHGDKLAMLALKDMKEERS